MGKALPEGQEYPIVMADTPLISPQSPATPRWRHYWSLMRADRPIGTLLLLWPTWWALWLAAGGLQKIVKTRNGHGKHPVMKKRKSKASAALPIRNLPPHSRQAKGY